MARDIVSIHTLVLDVSVSAMDYVHTNISAAFYSIPTTGFTKDSI